jgi:hypothetical protein
LISAWAVAQISSKVPSGTLAGHASRVQPWHPGQQLHAAAGIGQRPRGPVHAPIMPSLLCSEVKPAPMASSMMCTYTPSWALRRAWWAGQDGVLPGLQGARNERTRDQRSRHPCWLLSLGSHNPGQGWPMLLPCMHLRDPERAPVNVSQGCPHLYTSSQVSSSSRAAPSSPRRLPLLA